MHSGCGNHSPLSGASNQCFAMYDDKTSHAFTVTLHDDLLDFAQPLRRFHVDDSTSE
jgi:hypothetical protein